AIRAFYVFAHSSPYSQARPRGVREVETKSIFGSIRITSDASRNALKPTGESIGSEFLLTTKHNPKYTTRIIHCAVKKRNGTTLSALPNVFAQDFRATRPQSRWGRLQSQIDCVEGRRHIRMRELGVRTGNPGKLAELPWHSHPTRR